MSNVIVVGVDGSPGSAAAVEWAARQAAGHDAQVVAVAVITGAWELDAVQLDSDRTRERVTQLLEDKWTQPFRDAGVTFRCVVREGTPAAELRGIAESEEAALVVLGHTGHSGIGEHVLGGTTHRLLVHPAQPVVVVPVPAEAG